MNALNETIPDVASTPPSAPTATTGPAGSTIVAKTTTTSLAPFEPTPIPGKVAISFIDRDTDAKLVASSGRILAMLTGNPHFTSPRPALATVAAAQQAFVATVDGIDGRPVARVVRDKARSVLAQLLRTLALYVQQESDGDRGILLGSGFPLQKPWQPAARPGTPRNLRLRQGVSGSLLARVDPVAHARNYEWRIATAQAPTAWIHAPPSTRADTELVDLVPGTRYSIQARAIGTRGFSDWSDSAAMFVN